MSARAAPTPVEAVFADAFEALGSAGATRRADYDAFAARGLPHWRVEAWRWSDLRAALPEALERAAPAEAPPPARFADLDALRLDIVNGWLACAVEDADGLDFKRADATLPSNDGGGPTAALARALADDPMEIVVAPGAAPARPLVVRHVGAGTRAFHHERLRLVVGAEARLTLIESFEADAADGYANALLEMDLGPGARVDRIVVQSGREDAVMTSTALVRLDAGANLTQATLAFGGKLARLETHVAHAGANAEVVLDGASLLDARRHADATTVVTHAVPGGVTRELYKTVVAGKATGVFQGQIVVERGAQKTDARMGHHALLMNEGASVNAKPELEIYADDVQCAHGNTAGALDPDQLFYLQARGLPEARAKALVTEAFVAEAFARVADADVRDALLAEVRGWLGRTA